MNNTAFTIPNFYHQAEQLNEPNVYLMPGYPRVRLRTQSATKATSETLQQTDPRCRHADPVPLAMLCSGQELQLHGHLAGLLNGHQQCHGVFAAVRFVQQQQHAPVQGEIVFHDP